MRTCSVALATDIANEATTLCRLWKVTRTDGTIYRFTDETADVVVAADGTYDANVSFTCSAIFTSSALQGAQDVTLTFMMDDLGISENDIRSGLLSAAVCEVKVINYEDTTHGTMTLFKGTFGQMKCTDKAVAEVNVKPLSAALIGRLIGAECYSQTCRASLGDTRCGFDIEAAKVAFTVDSIITGTTFVASEFTNADNYFAQGYVKWSTGDNAGTKSLVLTSIQSSMRVTLAAAPLHPVVVGDTGFVYPGCDKVVTTCRDKFNRIPFMRAEPFVPGQDVLPTVPVASSGIGFR